MISGTPTAAGTYPVTIQATDSSTPTAEVSSANLSLVIGPPAPLVIVHPSFPLATVGLNYDPNSGNGAPDNEFEATGGTPNYSWTVTAGSLPPGLILAEAGYIFGTPTGHGKYTFTVQALDQGTPQSTAIATATIDSQEASPLTIETANLDNALTGVGFQATLFAAGGDGYYTWALKSGVLPTGMQLSGGTLVGVPTEEGFFTFTVEVTDSETPKAEVATQTLTLEVE
jgi:hypothetical protein